MHFSVVYYSLQALSNEVARRTVRAGAGGGLISATRAQPLGYFVDATAVILAVVSVRILVTESMHTRS